jgi:hypothetical protein
MGLCQYLAYFFLDGKKSKYMLWKKSIPAFFAMSIPPPPIFLPLTTLLEITRPQMTNVMGRNELSICKTGN